MKISLINKEAKWPALYPSVERKDPTVSDKGWDKVGNFTLRDKVDFMPQRGLQEKLCSCESNLVFLAGAASMGKTYCMLLNALRGIDKSGYTARFISVRLQDSKKGSSIFRDGVEILGNFAGCQYNSSDYPTFTWQRGEPCRVGGFQRLRQKKSGVIYRYRRGDRDTLIQDVLVLV